MLNWPEAPVEHFALPCDVLDSSIWVWAQRESLEEWRPLQTITAPFKIDQSCRCVRKLGGIGGKVVWRSPWVLGSTKTCGSDPDHLRIWPTLCRHRRCLQLCNSSFQLLSRRKLLKFSPSNLLPPEEEPNWPLQLKTKNGFWWNIEVFRLQKYSKSRDFGNPAARPGLMIHREQRKWKRQGPMIDAWTESLPFDQTAEMQAARLKKKKKTK